MANPNPNQENLIPLNKRTEEERKEIAKKGADAANQVIAQKKTMQQLAQRIAELKPTSQNRAVLETMGLEGEEEINNGSVMLAGLYKRALTGDPQAVKLYLEVMGQAPSQSLTITTDGATAFKEYVGVIKNGKSNQPQK